jgi:ubiquinone/menaquinone biosynthesis C-methylase UbiE
MRGAGIRTAHMGGPFAQAAGYDRITSRHLRGLDARIVADVAAAGLGPADRLLDAGTGPGRLPRAIAGALPDLAVDGVDLSADMIQYANRAAKNAARITFTVGDVTDLPYPDGTFTLIVSSISQHHWTDVEGALRDLHRVLRPGGRLWIYVARFALRRATAAARAVFPSVEREAVRTSRLPVRLIARLSAQA